MRAITVHLYVFVAIVLAIAPCAGSRAEEPTIRNYLIAMPTSPNPQSGLVEVRVARLLQNEPGDSTRLTVVAAYESYEAVPCAEPSGYCIEMSIRRHVFTSQLTSSGKPEKLEFILTDNFIPERYNQSIGVGLGALHVSVSVVEGTSHIAGRDFVFLGMIKPPHSINTVNAPLVYPSATLAQYHEHVMTLARGIAGLGPNDDVDWPASAVHIPCACAESE